MLHTSVCQGPLPAAFHPNMSSPVWAWDWRDRPLPPWPPPRLLGVAHRAEQCLQAMGNSFVNLVFTQSCAHTNGHIFYLSNIWCEHYDCDLLLLPFLEVKTLPSLCERYKEPVWESAFLSRGPQMAQWPWHSIFMLTMFNCVSTAFHKGAYKARVD